MAASGERLWTVEEYYRMAEVGILSSDEKVELIEGEIMLKSPKNSACAATIACAADYLGNMLSHKGFIRLKAPLRLSSHSEPEPDIAIVRFDPQRYPHSHPTPDDVFLVIEVADIHSDKESPKKHCAYAKAGIADYWILDVSTKAIHVFRQPEDESYQEKTILTEEAILSPLAFPDVKLQVSQLFPWNLN